MLASLAKASLVMFILIVPLAQIAFGPIHAVSAAGSWNSNVACTPITVKISDITAGATGQTSFNNSPFSPGITTTVSGGVAKRWLTPGSTPSGWHSPGPSCTITNNKGQSQGVFVEIDGIERASAVYEDSSSSYDATNGGGSYSGGSRNDHTFNAFDPAIVSNYQNSCTSAGDPTCYGRIHIEIDHDWQAAGYCGAGSACDPAALDTQTTSASTIMDFQGFVYWDGASCCSAQDHSFSGWELHPLTGWRIHTAGPSASFTFNPSSPTVGQAITFTGSASGGTSPYTFAWTFGDGATGTGSTTTHSYSASGSYTVQLTVTDSKGLTGTSSQLISVSPPTTNFSISSSPSSLTIQSGTSGASVISLTSQGGFTGTVSLSSTVSPSGLTASLSPVSVSLSSGGSGSSTLTVLSSTTGTYTVTVTGTSGSLTHTTTVTVSVVITPDFTISSTSSSITMQSGSPGTATLTLTSLNGFSGSVSLSTNISPSGLTASVNPTSVSLSSGGTGTSTLTASSQTAGTYTVTITGTSGSLTHSIAVTVSVTALTSVTVASDGATGPSSIGTGAGQKILQDSAGRLVAVYIDSAGRISLSYANSDPTISGWSTPVKSVAPTTAYSGPSAVFVSMTSLQVFVAGGTAAGMLTQVPVTVQRDSQNNITGFAFGTPTTLDSSGSASYPSSVLAHNGDILLAWAYAPATSSQVRALRWDPATGWTNFAGTSATPDSLMSDTSNLSVLLPSIIERLDNYNVYVLANRLVGPPSTVAFNKATWNGSVWSWGAANLTYESNSSDGGDDPITTAWDPVKSLVVVSYGITGTTSYGVFTLDSSDVKTHLDTPSYPVSERGYGEVAVHVTTGDYYLFFMGLSSDDGPGPLNYVRHPTGGAWNTTIAVIDANTSNQGLSVRASGAGVTVDLLYVQGTSAPTTIKFTRLSPFNPPNFAVSASPVTLTVQAGSSGTSTITLTSQFSFTGVVTLSTSVSPTGLATVLSSISVSLTSGGTGTSTLTVSPSTVGNYTVSVVAATGSLTHTVKVTVRVVDFSVSAAPTTVNIIAGQSGSSTLSLKSLGGFAGTIALTSTVSPSGLTTSFNPTSVTLLMGGSGTSALTLSSSIGGTYVVTVTGTSNGVLHTAQLTVNVADFSLTANPSIVGFQLGSNASTTMTATSLGGFSGTVGLNESVNPASGLAVSCNQVSLSVASGGSASSSCSFSATAGGTYTVTVTATSGTLSHTTTVTVGVGDFTLSATPASISFSTGGSASSTINLGSLNSFAGTISLSTSVSPSSGLSISVNPASVGLSSGGTGTSTVSLSSTTIGTYNVTIRGMSGSLAHSATILVTVTLAPDFSTSASSSNLIVQSGFSSTATINLASLNGFSGTVTLSTAAVPASGSTSTLSPTSVTLTSGGSGSSTINISSSTPGNYTITITGTSGSLTHSIQVVVQVVDFSVSANPVSLTAPPGTSANSTINLSSINGLSGSVSLSATVSPSGPSLTVNPSTIVLSSSGTGTSTLTFSSTSSLVPGTYTVTITATIGSLSHTATVTVNVPDFSLTASPSTVNILVGAGGSSTISVISLGGFTGTINLTEASSSGSLIASLSTSSLTLSSGGSGTSTLSLSSSVVGTYIVTVTGTSGSTTHTVTVTVNVQDFSLSTDVGSLSLAAGSSGTVTINLASINGFTGTVSLSAVCSPTGPTLSLSLTSVSLSSGSGTSTLTIRTKHRTAPGTYTITITGTSGGVTHTVTVTLTIA